MFDHITLRAPDLATARTGFAVVLNEQEIQETSNTRLGKDTLTQLGDILAAIRSL